MPIKKKGRTSMATKKTKKKPAAAAKRKSTRHQIRLVHPKSATYI